MVQKDICSILNSLLGDLRKNASTPRACLRVCLKRGCDCGPSCSELFSLKKALGRSLTLAPKKKKGERSNRRAEPPEAVLFHLLQ
jgi:hypothetical protein